MDFKKLGPAFIAELKQAGVAIDPALEGQLLAGVESGDADFLDQGFAEVSFQPLPNQRGLGALRPAATIGRWPQQPTASGPGAIVKSFRQILAHVAERAEIAETFGAGALVASPGHQRNALVAFRGEPLPVDAS